MVLLCPGSVQYGVVVLRSAIAQYIFNIKAYITFLYSDFTFTCVIGTVNIDRFLAYLAAYGNKNK